MKMSRKDRKLKKRNLRDKRKRKIENKKELANKLERESWKTSSSISNLRIDKAGNITRFINQHGVVSPNETKMFGCEIEKSVPQYIKDYAEKLNLGAFIRVPIRTKGLTGSGESFKCHYNVSALTKRYGGQWLRGYGVCTYKDGNTYSVGNNRRSVETTQFIFHSVWITPEGNAVCVSNNYAGRFDIEKDLDNILFIPFGLDCIEEFGLEISNLVFHDTSNPFLPQECYICPAHDAKGGINFPVKALDLLLSKGDVGQGALVKSEIKTEFEERVCEGYMSKGWFSNRSLISGKSWSELRTDVGIDKYSALPALNL